MPGPVSDSYDPEWSTSANAEEIRLALGKMYDRVSRILSGAPPMYILDLVRADLPNRIPVTNLTEKEWRIIRFALERAGESI